MPLHGFGKNDLLNTIGRRGYLRKYHADIGRAVFFHKKLRCYGDRFVTLGLVNRVWHADCLYERRSAYKPEN
jgi:hypothetical protein